MSHNRDISLSFSDMKVCYVFSLELPHPGDSNEYTQHTLSRIKKENHQNYPKYNNVCGYGIFFVRDSRTRLK